MKGLQDTTGQLELLAPARNCDIGIAAIDCGADAVYIAGPAFGARQAAGNSMEDIKNLCRYAHRFGARIFITFNTILYDNELQEARRLMHGFRDAGADALIVQDLAILKMAAEDGLDIPLHASTQCAIRTPEDASFLESLGFSRLVLERELSLEQIRKIRDAVSCELEFFVHGALCVCYSGQCYLSENLAGRSANRGACIQACRSRYDLTDREGNTLAKDKTLLSLKDFRLRNRLEDLAEAGVTSFKIEGRLKNISYVKNVVRDYSIAIDRIIEKQKDGRCGTGPADAGGAGYCRASFGKVSGGFMPDTDKTFNRGYTELFIDGKRGSWASLDSAKSMGEEIGTISYVSKDKDMLRVSPSGTNRNKGRDRGKGEWRDTRKDDGKGNDGTSAQGIKELKLNNGDGFSFVRGAEVIGFRGDICNGLEIRCKRVPELFVGARLYRNVDTAFEKMLERGKPVREITVGLEAAFSDNTAEGNGGTDRLVLTVSARSEDGRCVTVTAGAGSEEAADRERMMSVISGQLSKRTGHYRFELRSVRTMKNGSLLDSLSVLPFMTAAALNGIRRSIAAALDEIPCNRLPLLTKEIPQAVSRISGFAAYTEGTHAATYRENIANRMARAVYEAAGFEIKEMAYELEHPQGAELMRTKYCIRHELGICPKQKKGQTPAPLYLLNNGRRLVLNFDCSRCEMTVSTPQSRM